MVDKLEASAGSFGAEFLSCASARYEFAGWPLIAGVLVNASAPTAFASALPGMKEVSGILG